MTTQPEALRLATELHNQWPMRSVSVESAAELRRLHAINGELLEALKLITEVGDRAATEIARAAIAKATGEAA